MCHGAVVGAPRVITMRRPVLRPGLRVVRRDDTHLQLGLDDPDRLVLPELPGLLDALGALPLVPRDEEVRRMLDELARDGWNIDGAQPDLRSDAAARRALQVSADACLRDLVSRACSAAGVRVDDGRAAGLRLVATVGEPRRALADDLMRDDVPHLWLAAFPASVRIGPFVQPGRTACLHCIDAHLGDHDPRRATVLHQLGEHPASADAAYDAALAMVGAGWALRDVSRHHDGERAALRSTTVTVTSDLGVTRREWLRHPHCGCAWG
jgi:hypothetical protein